MGKELVPLLCTQCGTQTQIKVSTNHILHLLLSVLTGGLWAVVWFFSIGHYYTCTGCGSRTKP